MSAAVVGEDVVAIADQSQCAVGDEPIAKLDAETPGEVVVARAGRGDRVSFAVLAQGTDRGRWRDLRDGLQRFGDVAACEFVVAVAALAADADEPPGR